MTANNMHDDWWKQAVVYQVYPRSFRDANGDGLGDIAGITEQVPYLKNHTSNMHEWFQAALTAEPGSPERDRYIFREGRGEHGELPPNDWQSLFGGPAWQRVADGQWYLHIFTVEQPDLNWKNPEVHEDFKKTLRFWSDRGVDGFRIDVAHGLAKDLDSKPRVRHRQSQWEQPAVGPRRSARHLP